MRVIDLLVARQPHPDPHRGDDLESRVQRMRRDIEADLVVALAGAAVGDRIGAFARGDLDEELRDERPGQRRGQRVGALVERVRLEVRPDEIGHEALAGVHDIGARGPRGHRSFLDARAQRPAAQVHRERDDLDAVLLLEPGDGDGRIESARVGEDDLVHETGTSGIDRTRALKRSSQRSRRGSSAKRTRSVLSPASVPSCSVRLDSSMAWATTLAVPGVPVRTRMRPLRPTLIGTSARMRRSRSSDAGRGGATRAHVLRRDVHVAVGAGRLEQPELGDVAADGGLGDIEPLLGQRIHEFPLAPDRTRNDELTDGALPKPLEFLARGHGHRGGGRHAAPTRAGRTAVIRVPNDGSPSARSSACSADESAMIASAPSQPSADRAARTLGTMPPAMTPVSMRCSASATVSESSLWPSASRTPSTSVSRTSWRAPEPGGDPGRGVVGVDVADDALGVTGERRDHRHLTTDEDRVEQVATQPGDARHEPEVGDPVGDEQAAIDAGQAHGIDAEVAQARDELAVDDAAQDGRRDLEALGVGHAETALELAGHAEALQPFGDPLAAAVDEDDGPATRDRGHLAEHLGSGRRSSSRPA